jgi:hypothetical protein
MVSWVGRAVRSTPLGEAEVGYLERTVAHRYEMQRI